jgi:hypothetical protein
MKRNVKTFSSMLVLVLASFGGTACATANKVHAPSVPTPTSDWAADVCAGLPEAEQERPSFLRAEGIEGVHAVLAEPMAERSRSELRGAEIVLRSSTTVTEPWVARVLRCHLADPVAVALGGQFENPLVVGTPTVSLNRTGDRVTLRIVGRGTAQGEEILRRAEQLRHSR